MQLQISDEWRVSTDGLCYALQRKHRQKAGREGKPATWSPATYHPTLVQLCDALVEKHLLQGDCTDLPGAVHAIHCLRDEIRQAILMVLPETAADFTEPAKNRAAVT